MPGAAHGERNHREDNELPVATVPHGRSLSDLSRSMRDDGHARAVVVDQSRRF